VSKRNAKGPSAKNIPIPEKLVKAMDPLLREQRRVNEHLNAVLGTARIILDVPDGYQVDFVKKAFVPGKEKTDGR